MKYGISDLSGLVVSQARGFIDISRLKLRILGFSNKRSGLMTKLGETAFKAMEAGSSITDDAEALRLVDQIREASDEITKAEDEINARKAKGLKERREFREKGVPVKETDPPPD